MKKPTKKMHLRAVVVRNLTPPDLASVRGGDTTSSNNLVDTTSSTNR